MQKNQNEHTSNFIYTSSTVSFQYYAILFFSNKSGVYSLSGKKMAEPRERPKKMQSVQKHAFNILYAK